MCISYPFKGLLQRKDQRKLGRGPGGESSIPDTRAERVQRALLPACRAYAIGTTPKLGKPQGRWLGLETQCLCWRYRSGGTRIEREFLKFRTRWAWLRKKNVEMEEKSEPGDCIEKGRGTLVWKEWALGRG